jgi:hypothetical protein
MSAARVKPMVSMLALVAVLVLTEARVLHSEPFDFDHTAKKTSALNCTPCLLCDTPACAVVVSAAHFLPHAAPDGRIAADQTIAHSSTDEFSPQVRPPPVLS